MIGRIPEIREFFDLRGERGKCLLNGGDRFSRLFRRPRRIENNQSVKGFCFQHGQYGTGLSGSRDDAVRIGIMKTGETQEYLHSDVILFNYRLQHEFISVTTCVEIRR